MGATPNKEIQRQHEEALALVADDLECSPSIDHGEISLHQKEIPTEESLMDHCGEEKKEEDVHFICVSSVSSRGRLDVSSLQDLFREGYSEAQKETADKK